MAKSSIKRKRKKNTMAGGMCATLIVCQFHLGRAQESCGTIFGTVLPELSTWKLPTQNQLGLVQV